MHLEKDFVYDEMLNKINIMHNILVDIKSGTDDDEQINELFRSIHTVKGVADLLFLTDIVDISHKAEDLLDDVREGKIYFDSKMAHLFSEIKDFLSLMLNNTYHDMGDEDTIAELSTYFDKKIKSFKMKTVLVISEFDINDMLEQNSYKGFNIISTNMMDEGLYILNENNIDMLFIDIEDYETELEDIENLKETSKYRYLPIVIMVSKNYPNLKYAGKRMGAKAWIEKPIAFNKMFTIIKKVFG